MDHLRSVLLIACPLILAVVATGCGTSGSYERAQREETVAGVSMLQQRVFVAKTDVLPTGDMIKQWYWQAPWEIRTLDGRVVRRMHSPGRATDGTGMDGPHITVIQDPQRGTIYETLFVQRTDKAFDLPMTLYFFSTRDAPNPLFSLPFHDPTNGTCQGGRVSRGSIKTPGITQSLFESAQWVTVGWDSTTYKAC